jgi:cobalt-zinc-cadmium efflux system membrane fusion protein
MSVDLARSFLERIMSSSSTSSTVPAAVSAEHVGQQPVPPENDGWLRAIVGSVPMLLTFALLAGVAYWGHYTEWTFAMAHRDKAKSATADKVEDLLRTESSENDSTLKTSWCERHGIAPCPLCDRSLAQVLKPLEPPSADELEEIQKAFAVRDREANNPECLASGSRVRLASNEAAVKLGIDVAPVWEAALTETITASGEVSFDATRVVRLAARVPGTAWQVTKQIGDPVKAGDLLAIIDAAEVGKAKAELLHAVVQVRLKEQALANLKNAPVPEQQKKEAAAARRDAEVGLLSAEQALINLGLPVKGVEFGKLDVDELAQQLQRLGLSRELSSTSSELDLPGTLLPVRAPFDGVVMQVDVIAGEVVDLEDVLFVIADPRQMWVNLNVPAVEARWVQIGQAAIFRPDGIKSEFRGYVDWIGTSADETTRTIPVRVVIPNEPIRLRASALGVGRIVLREAPHALTVPNDAVQTVGDCEVVFVRDKDFLKPNGPKVFHARMVRTGAKDVANTELLVGVANGEVVATKGSQLLAGELKRHHAAVIAGHRSSDKQHSAATSGKEKERINQ